MLNLNKIIAEEAPELQRKDRIVLAAVRFLKYGLSVNATLVVCMAILRPDSPELLTSVVFSNGGPVLNITLRIMATLLFIWTINTSHKGVTAMASLYTASVFLAHLRLVSMKYTMPLLLFHSQSSIINAMGHFFHGQNFCRFRDAIEKDPQKVMGQLREFKALAVLMKIYEHAISVVLPAVKFVTIIPAIFALYAVVRIGGITAVFAGVYGIDTIMFTEIILNGIAQVWIGSVEWREEMGKCVERRNSLLAKEVRSLAAIIVRPGGSLYFVDKGLVLTVVHLIVVNSVNMLLLNP